MSLPPGTSHNQQSRSTRDKYDRIVEIVRANPGAAIGHLSDIFYADSDRNCNRRSFENMLAELCYQKRIRCVEINRYEELINNHD